MLPIPKADPKGNPRSFELTSLGTAPIPICGENWRFVDGVKPNLTPHGTHPVLLLDWVQLTITIDVNAPIAYHAALGAMAVLAIQDKYRELGTF